MELTPLCIPEVVVIALCWYMEGCSFISTESILIYLHWQDGVSKDIVKITAAFKSFISYTLQCTRHLYFFQIATTRESIFIYSGKSRQTDTI